MMVSVGACSGVVLLQPGPTGIDRTGQAYRGMPRRTLAALKTCKTKTANNDVAGRIGFEQPLRMAV
jgi:hypothetical protein